MKAILGIVILCAAVFAMWFYDDTNQANRESAYWQRQERAAIQLERERQRADLQMQVDAIALPVMQIVLLSVASAVLIGIPALVGVGAISFFRRRHGLVYPDAQGRIPIRLDDAAYQGIAAAALSAFHQVEHERARHSATVPLHYAPHISYAAHPVFSGAGSESPAADAVVDHPAVVPSFAAILRSGEIGRGAPLLLGYHAGQPLTGAWRDLYSTGLGGLQGSGKTWTAAFLLAQSALNGARLLVVDPHAGDGESLAQRIAPLARSFLADIATDEAAIVGAMGMMRDELRRRSGGSPDRWALVIAIDEWTSLLRHELRNTLPPFLADIATEGRKFNMHALLLGQRWSVDASGGGEVRNMLSSHYVHRTRREEARMQMGLTGASLPDDTLSLEPGHAYLLSTRGTLTRVAIPVMQADDLATVGRMLTNTDPPIQSDSVIHQSHISHTSTSDYSALQSPIVSTENARIVGLFLDGKDAGAIVTELTGMTSKAGKPYMLKLTEVQATIRNAMRQGVQR